MSHTESYYRKLDREFNGYVPLETCNASCCKPIQYVSFTCIECAKHKTEENRSNFTFTCIPCEQKLIRDMSTELKRLKDV